MVMVLGDVDWYHLMVVLDDGCSGWCVYQVVIVMGGEYWVVVILGCGYTGWWLYLMWTGTI